MNISHLSKIAFVSIISLGLASSPTVAAKISDPLQKTAEHVAALEKQQVSNKTININKANKKELISSLSGIGDKKAQAIIDYRNKHGAFKSVKDLIKVKGIGKKLLANNIENILLTGAGMLTDEDNSKKIKQRLAKMKTEAK